MLLLINYTQIFGSPKHFIFCYLNHKFIVLLVNILVIYFCPESKWFFKLRRQHFVYYMLLFHVLHRLQHKQFLNCICSTQSSFLSVWILCVSLEGYIGSPNIYWTSCLLSWVLVALWMETTSLLSRGDSNRSKLKMFWGDTLKSTLRVIRVARLTPFCRRTLAFSSYSVRRVVPGVRLPASSRASRWLICLVIMG